MHTEVIDKKEYVFSRVNVNSGDFMREIYHQRYHVFCEECGMLEKECRADHLESDKFDPYSLHFVALDDDHLVGNVRLVLDNPHGLPMMEHVKREELGEEFGRLEPARVAEISRLLITRRFRKNREKLYYPICDGPHTSSEEKQAIRRARPVIMGLSREMYLESLVRGISHCVALMEKPLWQLLRIYGLPFRPIGGEVDYHGLVRPYICEAAVIGKRFGM